METRTVTVDAKTMTDLIHLLNAYINEHNSMQIPIRGIAGADPSISGFYQWLVKLKGTQA